MKSYLLLLKLNLINLWASLSGGSLKKDNGKLDISRIVLYALALLSLGAVAVMLVWGEVALYDVLAAVGQEKLLIGLAVMLSMLVTLMFGIPQTLASLYLAKDTPMFAHLPVSARTVMAAKWTLVFVMEVLTSLVFVLPLVVLHGLRVGDAAYWLRSLTAMLAAPVYPMALALVLASLVGRLSSLTKHKDAWLAIGSMLMVALVLSLEWTILPQIPDDADAVYFLKLMTDNEALLQLLIGAFPPVLWTVQAISGSWAQWALLLGVGLAAVAALIFLLGGDYLAVCLRHTEQGVIRKKGAARQKGERTYTERSPLAAIFLREMNEVLRIPTYFLNGVVGVLMPAIMLMGASIGMKGSEGGEEAMSMLLLAWNGFSAVDQMLIIAAVMALLCWIDTLPSTCISREGKRLQVTRMIPVPALTIVRGKLLVSLMFNGVGALLMGGAVLVLLGGEYLPQVLGAMVLVNLLSYAVSIVNMAADTLKPSFNWKNETEAIKQNMNSLIGMLFSTAMLALLIAPPLLLMDVTTPLVRLAIVGAVLLVQCAAAFLLLHKVVAPRYGRLEP